MSKRAKKWISFLLRWGIAVVGVYWVLANISWRDRVLITGKDGWPVSAPLTATANESGTVFTVQLLPSNPEPVARENLIARADRPKVTCRRDNQEQSYAVLGLKVSSDPNRSHWPIVVAPPRNLWDRY